MAISREPGHQMVRTPTITAGVRSPQNMEAVTTWRLPSPPSPEEDVSDPPSIFTPLPVLKSEEPSIFTKKKEEVTPTEND